MPDSETKNQPQISMIQQIAGRLATCIEPTAILDMLNSGCQPVQELALRKLQTLMTQRDCSQELQSALLACDQHVGVINAMTALEPASWTAGCDVGAMLRSAMRSATSAGQIAVARLICRKRPSQIPLLLESLNMPIARILCVHAARGELTNDAIISLVRFMTESGKLCTFPPVLGIAISPHWLAQFADDNLVIAKQLAESFGSIELDISSFPCTHLHEGICFINDELAGVPVDRLRDDLLSISRHLLSLSGVLPVQTAVQLHDGRGIDSMDLRLPLDQAMFFAAVREYEREDFAARPLASAFSFTSLRDEASDPVRFLHLPSRMLRERLVHAPLKIAESLSVPAALQTRFVSEYAMTQLRHREDQRTESLLCLSARWAAMRDAGNWATHEFQPIRTQNGNLRFPETLTTVIPDRSVLVVGSTKYEVRLPATPAEHIVSPCAAACLRLMAILNHAELQDARKELRDNEKSWSGVLLPLGMEIQIPHVDDTKHVGWKELFRSIGIPSPRRPECGRMLELALPPSVSWHAPCRILKLVAELGVPITAQDLAIHVSLQGDLGRIAGYLAFTQLFMNSSSFRAPRPRAGLRHVMSKGLVHLNHNVSQCRWAHPATCRTELRVVIARVLQSDNRLHIDGEALDCVRQIQLIASASTCSASDCRQMAQEFVESLRAIVQNFPPCLRDLLEADFYESTGDYRAVELLDSLTILKLREEARLLSAEHRAAFRQAVSETRASFAARIEINLRQMSVQSSTLQ